MDITKLGADILSDALGTSVDADSLSQALSGLLGSSGGELDLAGLVSKMSADGDLSSIVSSWLGDGENSGVSPDKILSILGNENVTAFAKSLGVDLAAASGGLAAALPQMVDKSSSGGSLLDSLGGVEGVFNAASKLLG